MFKFARAKSTPCCWIFAPFVRNFFVPVCCWQQHFQQDGVFAAFECKTIFAEEFPKRKMFFWPIAVVHVFGMKTSKKHFGVLQLFLQILLCLQKLHEQSLLKILLPATNSNNNTSYKRVQILTQNLHQSVAILPLMQEMLLSEFFAGSGISSKMLFMQPSKAKKTLQKELQNNKCFFTLFCPSLSSYNTCKCNLGQLGRKTTWCFATLFCKNWFCIWRLRKHHVAGNAVASNRLRQWHSLQQEGPNPNTTSWNKLLKNLPIQKRRPAHSKVASPFTGRYRQVAATMKVLCREILISTMQYGANRKVGGWTDEWLERTSKRRKNDGLIARTAKLMENWGEHENTLLNMPNTFWHTRHLLLHMPKFCARTNSTRNEKWPMEIAERGFDPRTFGLWAQHANHCATPLYHIILQAKFQ